MIENVIFDLGTVLLNIDPKRSMRAFRALAKDESHWSNSWTSFIHHIKAFEEGRVDEADFLNLLRNKLQTDANNQELTKAWNEILLDFPESRIRLLNKVRTHYKTYLLSNSNIIHYNQYSKQLQMIENKGFDDYFDGVVFSFRESYAKPKPEIYKILLQRYQLDPEKTLFIDDMEQNIIAADNAGITGLWLREGIDVVDIFDEEGKLRI